MDPITLAALLGGTAGGAALRVGGSRALGAGVGGLGSYLGAKSVSERDDNKQVKEFIESIKLNLKEGKPITHEMRGILSGADGAWGDLDIDKDLLNEARSLNEYFKKGYKENPFTKDLPQGDTMSIGDFR